MNKNVCRNDAVVRFTQILAAELVSRYGSHTKVSRLLGNHHNNSIRAWEAGKSTISRGVSDRVAPLLGLSPSTMNNWLTRLENGSTVTEEEIREVLDSPVSHNAGQAVASRVTEVWNIPQRAILLELVSLEPPEFYSLVQLAAAARGEIDPSRDKVQDVITSKIGRRRVRV